MSVMKKILTFFMLLLILCACETRLTDNTDQDIFDFPKYREGVININTHNYMPSMAKEKIGVTNERSSDSEILSRVTEVLKDSLWKDDLGELFMLKQMNLLFCQTFRDIFSRVHY